MVTHSRGCCSLVGDIDFASRCMQHLNVLKPALLLNGNRCPEALATGTDRPILFLFFSFFFFFFLVLYTIAYCVKRLLCRHLFRCGGAVQGSWSKPNGQHHRRIVDHRSRDPGSIWCHGRVHYSVVMVFDCAGCGLPPLRKFGYPTTGTA